MLMAALQYVDYPEYSGIIFRKSYSDLALPGAIMDRARSWLQGTAAKWNEQKHTFTFPSGATLAFGYIQHDSDRYRYQGSAFHLVAFDELTQFSEVSYRYLFSRMRRLADSPIPIRMRSASNPGGIGHDWVLQRFMVESSPSRVFVPSKLSDNPYLDEQEYIKSLEHLDPYTRAQLLEGNWFVLPSGEKFKRDWFPMVDAAPTDARRVRAWDLASSAPRIGRDPDYTAGCLMAEKSGQYWILDMARIRATPKGVEALVRQTADMDGTATSIIMEQEPGSSGVNTIDHYARDVLNGYAFKGVRSTGNKETRANPVSSAAEAGNIHLVRGPWISAFLDELVSFPGGSHDDQVDATSNALAYLATRRPVIVSPPTNLKSASTWKSFT